MYEQNIDYMYLKIIHNPQNLIFLNSNIKD